MAEKTGGESAAAENPVIIREIYESHNAEEQFEQQLERALEAQTAVIIIEPTKLGDETARWIHVGNCLHKTAVLSGLCCLAVGATWPDEPYFYSPGCAVSVVCAGVYAVSWQFDPCCKYQVEYDGDRLKRLPLQKLTSTSPVVLVRRNDSRRRILHNSLALASAAFCAWRFYEWFAK